LKNLQHDEYKQQRKKILDEMFENKSEYASKLLMEKFLLMMKEK